MRALNKASRKLPFFELQNVESVFLGNANRRRGSRPTFPIFPE
jgi:hypothetical protein